jgi:Bacteriophage protein of unknown function (DUF646).
MGKASLKSILESYGEAVRAELKTAIEQSANEVAEAAKSNCPVNTGALRDSIHAEKKSDLYYQVTASAENDGYDYARIVEFSPKINRPFMFPAAQQCRAAHKERIIEAIRKGAKQID